MSRRILLSQAGNYPINTIIKGVSNTITTRELLAAKLEINPIRIRSFNVYPDRLEVSIKGSYVMSAYNFRNNTDLTDYLDLGGLMVNIPSGAFQGCTNFTNIKCDNVSLSNGALLGLSNLTNPLYGGTIKIKRFGSIGGLAYTGFKKVIIETDNIFSGTLREMPNLEEIVLPYQQEVYIGTDALNSSTKAALINVEYVTSVGNRAFNATAFEVLDFQRLVSIGGVSPFVNMSKLKSIKFGSLVNVNDSESFLANSTSLEYVDIKKIKYFGSHHSNPSASARLYGFNGIKLNCVIEANITLATADTTDGTAHQSLKKAKANRLAIVKFYDDNGNYVFTL